MIFRYILYIIVQCTWGLMQTLIGFAFFLINIKRPHSFYKGCIETRWKKRRQGMSLGLFIFVGSDPDVDDVRSHEYGHTVQSLALGPFYIIVCIISVIWANLPYFVNKRLNKNIPYTACFVEKNASRLGEKFTGVKAI